MKLSPAIRFRLWVGPLVALTIFSCDATPPPINPGTDPGTDSGTDPNDPSPTGRPPVRTAAGLLGILGGPPPPCVAQVFAEVLAPDGSAVDADDNGTEQVELRIDDRCTIPEAELIWLQGGEQIAQGRSIMLDLPIGVHCYESVQLTESGVEPLVDLKPTVIGPSLPTAHFELMRDSFIDGAVGLGEVSGMPPDGIVQVRLEGSPSSGGLTSTIVSFIWSVDGMKVATGPMAQIALEPGVHSIRLTVENGEGLNHALELTDIAIVCPDCTGASPPNILDPADVAVDEKFSP